MEQTFFTSINIEKVRHLENISIQTKKHTDDYNIQVSLK